jgi:hypothetical protein
VVPGYAGDEGYARVEGNTGWLLCAVVHVCQCAVSMPVPVLLRKHNPLPGACSAGQQPSCCCHQPTHHMHQLRCLVLVFFCMCAHSIYAWVCHQPQYMSELWQGILCVQLKTLHLLGPAGCSKQAVSGRVAVLQHATAVCVGSGNTQVQLHACADYIHLLTE